MIVVGAEVFNVYRKRFEKRSVLIRDGVFAAVADGLVPPPGEPVLDASGAWLIPGLVDVHMHIESSMTTPGEFSRAALPHGTTTVVSDPHEIANVFGVEGIKAFMDVETEMDIFYGIPSSVPSTNPGLETTGGRIGPREVAELARDPRVVCLGEVMNAAELTVPGDTPTKRLVAAYRAAAPRSPVEGHCPRIGGEQLAAFVTSGVWADHTQQTPASILEKIDCGMFMELQRKSLTKENIAAIVENGLFEHFCLVTDDVMPDHLTDGHLNRIVELAMERGLRPEDAIYAATYAPSRHMGLRDRGAVAPGRIADFLLLDDPAALRIRAVYKRGREVPRGRAAASARPKAFPAHFYTSVRRAPLAEADFAVRAPAGFSGPSLNCTALRIEPSSTFTERVAVECAVVDGLIDWRGAGLNLVVAIERYGAGAPLRPGFVVGGLKERGAVASTWAHDHHNLLVLGTDAADMAAAANAVIAEQGGYVVASCGKVLADAPLRVGGIVSDAPIEELAAQIRRVRAAMKSLGYDHMNEIMSFSTLSLLVSPALKVSDKGLVDVRAQTLTESYELPHP